MIKDYSKAQLVKDIVAGIIVAIIALPLSIALALASGVEPACGVYTAIAAGFIVSLLGGSAIQIAGPTAAFATIVAGIVAKSGMSGLFLATVVAGIILIIMGIFKLGNLIKFIPTTITTGFTSGIAITIFIGQLKDFFGITYAEGLKPVEAIEKLYANVESISTFSFKALIVGVVCLAILIIYPKFEKRVPPSLIAVIVGILMVKFIPGLDDGVFTIGELYTIPVGLPKVDFSGISFGLDSILAVLPDAFTIAILAAIESLLSCVVADTMVNSVHNPNAELVAQGAGNIASVLFGGIPATGAIARTAANANNGGRTPVSGMVHSLVLLFVLLFLMPFAKLIPMPAIAAILFMVAYNMSEWRKVVSICKKAPKSDILVMACTLILTVVFDLVVAIAVGMVLAVVLFMKRMSDKAYVDEIKQQLPQNVKCYKFNGPLFFGSADKIQNIIIDNDTQKLIIDMSGVTAIDYTAMNSIESLYNKCAANGTALAFASLGSQPVGVMKKYGLYDKIGSQNYFDCVSDAI